MRIIAGRFGGRKLPAAVPPGARPTSDRVREALFSMLEARQAVAGAHVLDLYAGTGALGLEALSRGAASLTAVDKEPRALAAIRRNAAALDPSAPVHCVRGDVGNLSWTKLKTKNPSIAPFGLVLMDPPYADLATATKWLQRLTDEPWLCPDGLISVEMGASSTLQLPQTLIELRRQHYGDTAIVLLAAIN